MNDRPPEDASDKHEQELIDAAWRQAKVLRRAAVPAAGAVSTSGGLAADALAGYEILREIRRGGQGVVYQAIQQSTQRKVAIKVLKEGLFAGAADRARFEREVQVLGQLNHPNIVTIHDSGLAAGRHYFVMDYIPGQPLDAYVAAGERDVSELLGLFAKISDAVNAAHLSGIIHRDLKPANIRIDPEGQPHVLDFGLAKPLSDGSSLGHGLEAATVTGQFIGSLPWASPEQAEGAPAKIDMRTDVYSLGVILYQMLTGRFPYDVSGNARDALHNIMTAEPARPSALRGEDGRPVRHINDEVETIVLKCLHKQPERRYETAGALARDIRHYLADEPIEAKRDSGWYVLRKTLRRYRVPTAIAAAFVLAVSLGLVASLTFWGQAARERDRAEEVSRFTREMLSGISPEIAGSMDKELLRLILDNAAGRIEKELAEQPDIAASLHATIGSTYRAVGEYPLAEPHLDEALRLRRANLGDEHPDTLMSIGHMGELLQSMGKYEDAELYFREALEGCRRVLGDDDPDTLTVIAAMGLLLTENGHYEHAEPYAREALEGRRRVLGDDHRDTLGSINDMGYLLEEMGKYDEAEPYYREALEGRRRVLGDDHPDTLGSINNMAGLLQLMDKRDEAEPYWDEALEGYRRVLGDNHPYTLLSINNMAGRLQSMGKLDEAEKFYREALQGNRRVLGDEHPQTLLSINNMGFLLEAMGEPAEAEPCYREALQGRRRVLGDDHQDTLVSIHNMGGLLRELGRLEEAEALGAEAVRGARRSLREGHWYTGIFLANYGKCLAELERYAEAESALLEASGILETALGPEQERTIKVIQSLAELYEAWDAGEPDKGYDAKAAEWRAKLKTVEEPEQPRESESAPT